jgi:pyruvate formate lyase activating enzyme
MDAANVDLKGFSERFYRGVCGGERAPVLETLEYVAHETDVWVEITNLVIPGHNDSDEELGAMTRWIVERLGPDVPVHFTAFHPDYRLLDVPPTPPATLRRACAVARANGIRYAYTGNVVDPEGQSTRCHACGALLVERDWYRIGAYRLRDGRCPDCGVAVPGVFGEAAGSWRARRVAVRLGA